MHPLRLPLQLFRNVNWKRVTSCRYVATESNVSSAQKTVFKSHYTEEEEKAILKVLNESCVEEIIRFGARKATAAKIEEFRRTVGRIQTFEEVLRMKGMGFHTLDRMCQNILNPSLPGEENETKEKKKRTSFITPTPEPLVLDELQNAVGIHIGLESVSWASMDRDGNLLSWDSVSLAHSTKQGAINSFQEALNVRLKIPDGSLYLLEDVNKTSAATKQMLTSFLMHRLQFVAMLIALLNIDSGNNYLQSSNPEMSSLQVNQRVYFMSARLVSTLFSIMVGTERVSAQFVTKDILSYSSPFNYSPISYYPELKENYLSKDSIDRECMSLSLLLTMAFFDLIVHKNPQSLAAVSRRKK